ncbi:MAG TPA: hypothetical protein VFW73_08340, partial [Lacipirellulaceae bacterium]|nr:hypothetical protein [Lacipirellulaceae bacterium]
MSDGGFTIEVGPPDANGKRQVTATFEKLRHRDKFDVDDSFKRARFREQVISKFGLDESAHEYLEAKIMAAAEAEPTAFFKPVVKLLSTVTPK